MSKIRTVAIIGSFRQHYDGVCRAWRLFTDLGLEVTSPKGAPIIKIGIPFVRFTSDREKWTDPMVQTVALHRILRAEFVYVVAPRGYVGRTTCYEVGRIIQAQRPLYLSQQPADLPIKVPAGHILSLREIAKLLRAGKFRPQPMYFAAKGRHLALERELLLGNYCDDDEVPH